MNRNVISFGDTFYTLVKMVKKSSLKDLSPSDLGILKKFYKADHILMNNSCYMFVNYVTDVEPCNDNLPALIKN